PLRPPPTSPFPYSTLFRSQYVLIAVNRQAAITRAFLLGAAFNLGANLLLIPLLATYLGRPEWGLYAAAAVTILSELVLYAVFRPDRKSTRLYSSHVKTSYA